MSFIQILHITQLPATFTVHVNNINCPLTRLENLPKTMLKTVNTEFKYSVN